MGKARFLVWILLISTTLFFQSACTIGKNLVYDYTRDKEWLHHNTMEWLDFGPAVISSATRIDLRIDNVGSFKVVASDKNFSLVKQWVFTNFEPRLNWSPNETDFKSIGRHNYLMLYSKERGNYPDDALLQIPLSPRMLNTKEEGFYHQLNELKSKMTAYKPKD